jgi:hypothetical protein
MRRRKHAYALSPSDVRLLRDLVTMHVITEGRRPPAHVRLERRLGREFAHMLLASLVESPAKAA